MFHEFLFENGMGHTLGHLYVAALAMRGITAACTGVHYASPGTKITIAMDADRAQARAALVEANADVGAVIETTCRTIEATL